MRSTSLSRLLYSHICVLPAQFLAPIYVILKKTPVAPKDGQHPSGSETLSLYKATVPSYFNLSSLQSQYLPINAPIDSQDLEGLMRELRRRVILHGQRGDMLEGLRHAIATSSSASAKTSANSRTNAQIKWDEARENVVVEYNLPKAKVKGTLRLDETGKVLKCGGSPGAGKNIAGPEVLDVAQFYVYAYKSGLGHWDTLLILVDMAVSLPWSFC